MTPKPMLQCPHCHSFMNLVNVDEYLRTYSPSRALSASAMPVRSISTRAPLRPRILIPSPPPPPAAATASTTREDDASNADEDEEEESVNALPEPSSVPEERSSVQNPASEPPDPNSLTADSPPVSSIATAIASEAHPVTAIGSNSSSAIGVSESSIFATSAAAQSQSQSSNYSSSAALNMRPELHRVSRASKTKCIQLLHSIANEERTSEPSSDSSSDEYRDDDSEMLNRPAFRTPLDSSLLAASSASLARGTKRTASAAAASLVGHGARLGVGSASASSSLYIAMPRAEERLTLAARFVSRPAAAPRRHSSLRRESVSSQRPESVSSGSEASRAPTVVVCAASGVRTADAAAGVAAPDEHEDIDTIEIQEDEVEAANDTSSAANSAATLQWLQSPSCLPLEPLDTD